MSSPPDAPGLSAAASASRLVLLPNTDDDDDDDDPREYADDNDDHDDDDQLAFPALSPSLVFLYLLAPYLRLGALRALDFADAPLAYGLAALVVAASLSAFCRQIWFLLGRYLHKSSVEEILVHTFVRRHRTTRSARSTITILISALFRISLAAMYLRDAVDSALLLDAPHSFTFLLSSRFAISILISILVFVLSFPKSLASKPIIYATGLSVAFYLAWLVAISRSYAANELLLPTLGSFRRGALWTEISSLTFACTTTMTVPLSASLLAGTPLVPVAKNSRARSFEFLNVSSTTLAALLILPLVIISASPRAPASAATSNNLVLGLRIATLVLSIPSLITSTTLLPSQGLLRTNTALSITVVATLALSLVPSTIANVLADAMLFFAVLGGFLLPALAHVTIHYFRRPLAIVVPQVLPSDSGSPRPSDVESSPSPSGDPLLQRKERLLQRSRLGKRLLWDVVVWVLLLPACVCALVWAAGRLAHQS